MFKQIWRFTLPLLLLTACAQEDEAVKERGVICAASACLSGINVKFTTPRTQDYRITLEKPGLTIAGECAYNATLGRLEPVRSSTSFAHYCTASEIAVSAGNLENESAVTLEVFDALNISVERKQYPLIWSDPPPYDRTQCANPCNSANITTAVP